jgi:hypothetical protein
VKHVLIAVGIVALLLPQVTLRADDAPAAPAVNTDLILLPSPTVTLQYGEHVDLSVYDNQNRNEPKAGTVTWTVNDQPMGQIDASHGSLALPADDASGSAVTYTTPPKQSLKKHITITATVSGSGAPTKLTSDLIIVSDPNWFSIDGDTGVGQQNISIQLDPKISSAAGFGVIPFGVEKNSFVIHTVGTTKGGPVGQLVVDLSLGPNSQPGTYPWHLKNPFIAVDIIFLQKHYTSLDFASNISSLDGSTTIIKPEAGDPPGIARGFYTGRLRWGERTSSGTKSQSHYLTVRGHFALPGK